MGQVEIEKLLSDKRVVEEIQRHLWIESEKAGHDIGFDQAKEDWLKNFSKAWLEYHMPEALTKAAYAPAKAAAEQKFEDKNSLKRRRAKSYVK